MAGKLDVRKFRKLLSNNEALKQRITETFERQFDRAKKEAQFDFENHEVTKEIKAGPSASNTSKTLGGYGNLFSFLGFAETDDPTQTVSEILENEIRYDAGKGRTTSKGVSIRFTVYFPTMKDIYAETPMEWTSRSWVEGVENGSVDGFQYYLSRLNMPNSRSGGGVQIDNKLRSSKVRRTAYVSNILEKFKKRMEKIK
jgi:hypothetical protein